VVQYLSSSVEAKTTPDTAPCDIDPVGPTEIAARLNVPKNTANAWIYDKVLPPPRWRIGPGPVWDWRDIQAWAIATGRLSPVASAPPPPPRCQETPELVGVGEIAERLGIGKRAVLRRVERGRMPPPRWRVSARGVWLWDDLKHLPTNRNRRNTSR